MDSKRGENMAENISVPETEQLTYDIANITNTSNNTPTHAINEIMEMNSVHDNISESNENIQKDTNRMNNDIVIVASSEIESEKDNDVIEKLADGFKKHPNETDQSFEICHEAVVHVKRRNSVNHELYMIQEKDDIYDGGTDVCDNLSISTTTSEDATLSNATDDVDGFLCSLNYDEVREAVFHFKKNPLHNPPILNIIAGTSDGKGEERNSQNSLDNSDFDVLDSGDTEKLFQHFGRHSLGNVTHFFPKIRFSSGGSKESEPRVRSLSDIVPNTLMKSKLRISTLSASVPYRSMKSKPRVNSLPDTVPKVLKKSKLRACSLPDAAPKILRKKRKRVSQDFINHGKELDEETKWIRHRLKCRECAAFIPVESEKGKSAVDILCQCGHIYDEHTSMAKKANDQNRESTKWDYKHHSRRLMTDAFGEMEFVGYGGKIGKYVRVDVDTKMSDMLELMMKVWGMEKPNLLISVTGGAKNFKMSKRLKETFRRGLMKTALTTGAWIITGGTHAGVMKHVGEAVKDFDIASSTQNPVVTIGIAPWGCVQNRHALRNRECTGLWPAHYRIQKEVNPKESFIDPNHSHFILVDNATERKFAVEIPFRAKLEYEIAKLQTDTDGVLVPIVLLVLEGGIGTLETVHEAIQKNTPAVIVKGSGRAADILAFAYQNAKEEEIEAKDQEGNTQKRTRRCMEDALTNQVKEMVEKEFGQNRIVTHMTWIKDCLDKSDLMSVFELDNKSGSREIDVSMLQALLKANKNHVMDQLRLALAWNRIDVAKNDIFTDDKRWPTGSLDELMLSAIQLNRTDFVELFMDHGVSLREFLTKKRLLTLYNKMPMNNCLLRTLLNKVKGKAKGPRKNFSLHDVGVLIQELIGDYFQYIYTTQDKYAYLDADNELDSFTIRPAKEGSFAGLRAMTSVATSIGTSFNPGARRPSNSIQVDFENPAQELFIWSVLMIRQDMAKIFWADGKDAIAGALVANSLLKAMKEKTEDAELSIKIQEHIDEWSNLAIGVLNECHSTDERKAQDLLVRELGNWCDATCMLIAVKADNKEFISQTACQLLLNSIWMGKLTQENNALKLLMCTFFPPLALWLVTYHGLSSESVAVQPDTTELKEDPLFGTRKQAPLIRGKSVLSASTRNSRQSLRIEDETREIKDEDQPKLRSRMYSVRERFYYFFNAPVIIFLYNVVSYLVFLGLFTYILLFNFNPKVSAQEIVLIVWVFTIFTEELRQVAMTSSSTLTTKLQSYITDTWNVVDLITIGLFIIGTILRFIPDPDTFEAARLFLALNFFTFFLRLLHIFSVHKELGPKLVMIGRMVQDLMYFVLILMVFVVSYAIASHSILFPNSPLNLKTFNQVMRRSYWNIYGELFLDEIEGEADCTFDEALWINGTYPRCPSDIGKYAVPILMGVYMLLANVLLLNLLIAMFSYTFQKIQDNTDKHWFYQRYSLIYEYYTRPVLCPPFIVFSHVFLVIRYVVKRCCCACCPGYNTEEDEEDDFCRKFKNARELVQWENVIADAFHHKSELKQFQSTEYKVANTHDRLQMLINNVDEIQEMMNQQTATPVLNALSAPMTNRVEVQYSTPELKMPVQLDNRLTSLEQQMDVTYRSLEWIIKAMQANNLVPSSAPPAIPNLGEERNKEKELLKQRKVTEKQIVDQILEEGFKAHTRSRTSPYQGSEVIRFPVPDELVLWEEPFPEYSPVEYTAASVLEEPVWADPDIMNMTPVNRTRTISSFNTVDKKYNCNRVSYCGTYLVKDGLPYNPEGRTGICGRGLLGRWGPNLAGDPVVTRWKMTNDGSVEMKNGKPVLEFVAVERLDNKMWALPGSIMTSGSRPADLLEAEFTEEVLLSHDKRSKDAKAFKKRLKRLWRKGVMIFEGYADDPRNTDNAWLETTVYNYHDNDGSILTNFNIKAAGDMVSLATWLTASSSVNMHGSHLYFLKMVAERLGANF